MQSRSGDRSYIWREKSIRASATSPTLRAVHPGERSRLKAALLSNPTSRFNRRHLAEVRRRIDGAANIRHVETQHIDDVAAALADLAMEDTRVIAINGGDGTVHLVLSALMNGDAFREPPIVAVLPGGTTNMTARDLNGGAVRFFDALERFIARAPDAHGAQPRHVLQVRQSGAADRYGFFFGMGAIVRGIRFCHERVYRMGFRDEWAGGVALLRGAWGILTRESAFTKSVPLTFTVDAARVQADANLFFVSALEQLLLGIRPFWGEGDAPLRATLVRRHPRRFARTLPALLRGRPHPNLTPEAGYSSWRLEQMHVCGAGLFTIDGEIYESERSLRVHAAGPLRFLPLGPEGHG